MTNYETEQGADYGDASRMDADLKPWLREQWGLDVFLDEFPYFQYAGQDFPADEDEKVQRALEKDYRPDDPAELGDYVTKRGPYRTDVVGVSVDRQALATRVRRLGTTESMNGSRQAKRRRRRTYLTFLGDGPMTRDYWEQEHGGPGELRSYGEGTARKAFGWLKKRGFLRAAGRGRAAWDAVDIPLHVYGRTHAFELKLSASEWDTALEQAARSDVFADYRWVVYDRDTADRALANAEQFQSEGVGLITVSPEDGGEVHVWAEQCTPEVDRDALDRYNVERWDVNERILKELRGVREYHEQPEEHEQFAEPDAPDILGQMDADSLEIDPEPPTVHGGEGAAKAISEPDAREDSGHKPLTAFADGEGEV